MKNKILAYHWVKDDCTLRDGSPLVWHDELAHKGELVMCRSGYHASIRALDALQNAPGSVCCRVEIGGKYIVDTDKLVAEKRTVLWAVDAEKILHEFARWCALQVIHLWDAPECVRKFLETGDESLCNAAMDAAWAAAWEAQNNKLEEMLEEEWENQWKA